MYGKFTGYINLVCTILFRIDLFGIPDFSAESSFGIFFTLHIVFIEMLLHQRFFKMKILYGQGKLEITGRQGHHTHHLIVLCINILHRGFGEEGNRTVLGKELLGIGTYGQEQGAYC